METKQKSLVNFDLRGNIVIFLLISLLLFSGCTRESGPTKISWYYLNGSASQPDQDEIFDAVNKLTAEKLGIVVDYFPVAIGSYDKKMQVIINSGEEYDMCFTATWNNNYILNAQKSAYLPLDDLLPEYAPDLFKLIPSSVWDATRINGKVYGMPNYQISVRTRGARIATSVLKQLPFDATAFKNDPLGYYTTYLKTVKENGIADTPYEPWWTADALTTDWQFYEAIDTIGIGVSTKEPDKVQFLYTTPAFRTNLDAYSDWYESGLFPVDVATYDNQNSHWSENKVVATISDVKPGAESAWKGRTGIAVKHFPMMQPVVTNGSVLASLQAISVTSKHPNEALRFFNFLHVNKEAYNTLIFGIQGKHYELDSQSYVQKLADGYAGLAWAMGSQFNAYLLPGQDKDVWEETKNLNQSAKASPLLGFIFDSKPVKTEIANLAALEDEYKLARKGLVDPDEWLPEFLEKAQVAGIDKILAETQKQLDNWLASK